MDHPGHRRTSWRRVAATTGAALALLLPFGSSLPAAAEPAPVDPAALPRGADPTIAHLVRDTIRDGDVRVPAPSRGEHQALWVVAGGYLVRDYSLGPREWTRVVFVGRDGGRRVVTRSRGPVPVAVSASGRTVAVQRPSSPDGLRTVVRVTRARTGRLVAQRTVRQATLVAVTESARSGGTAGPST
ncbi:hypothetical protein [Nocardioides solisilvae]|uniref:hypothetical protein n=1 Tax=Nocardioides solisilvae TaxID=1542435 RepID=UPI001EF42009|nr:hypothetical protein [Nocardioides solisilvae]